MVLPFTPPPLMPLLSDATTPNVTIRFHEKRQVRLLVVTMATPMTDTTSPM
jgi:hypothetical protein